MKSLVLAALCCLSVEASAQERVGNQRVHRFVVDESAETVATIVASCPACDWGVRGRETVFLEVAVDGRYSQHVALLGDRAESSYSILLGRLDAGTHMLRIEQDRSRSAAGAGLAQITAVQTRGISVRDPEYGWISKAPVLRARAGSVEQFTDLPLLMYAERNVERGEGAGRYSLQYTVVFSNEDGGTATDRLLATWGRTSDIEFVYGITDPDGRELIQAAGHEWVDFKGSRFNGHPELWVATENNMVAGHGEADAIRFAPLPTLEDLAAVSRERVMDEHPWTYGVAFDEIRREGRIDDGAQPETGRVPRPQRYAVLEACADVSHAAVAIELGVGPRYTVTWFSSDRGTPLFRIARSGCFRAAAPLPAATTVDAVTSVRVRAFPFAIPEAEDGDRAAARATLLRVNRLLMVNDAQELAVRTIDWTGSQPLVPGGEPFTLSIEDTR